MLLKNIETFNGLYTSYILEGMVNIMQQVKEQSQIKTREFPFTTIMGVPFSKLSLTETEAYLTKRIEQRELTQVVTANPEIVMYGEQDPAYKQILQTVEMVVPDGIGVVYASKIQKDPVKERVAGYDLLHRIMYQANLNSWKVYLIGANEEVNKLAFERLQKDYPKAMLVGRHHGFFKDNSAEEQLIVEDIKKVQPDVLFVALGFPRQEQWIQRFQKQLQIPFAMGVGGSFDVLAGKVKRAPMFWQKLGLEWFYRLVSNPSRWRRMLVLPQFLVKQVFTRR